MISMLNISSKHNCERFTTNEKEFTVRDKRLESCLINKKVRFLKNIITFSAPLYIRSHYVRSRKLVISSLLVVSGHARQRSCLLYGSEETTSLLCHCMLEMPPHLYILWTRSLYRNYILGLPNRTSVYKNAGPID